jgi:photosystem II stability/assembly factor-like uncharacterized protein
MSDDNHPMLVAATVIGSPTVGAVVGATAVWYAGPDIASFWFAVYAFVLSVIAAGYVRHADPAVAVDRCRKRCDDAATEARTPLPQPALGGPERGLSMRGTVMRLLRGLALACGLAALALGTAVAPAAFADSTVQASWQIFDTRSPGTLIAVDVVDPAVIWAAGGGYRGAKGDGTVVRTVDGGRTWDDVTPPGGRTYGFRDVEAVDRDHAVVLASVSGVGAGKANPSRIFYTADGGATWEMVYEADDNYFYNSIAFFDDGSHGLAVSDPVNGKFPILATDNGGLNWKLTQPAVMPDALVNEFGRATGTSLVAFGADDAWFGTNPEDDPYARVFHTQDAGTSWSVAETTIDGGPAGILSLSFRDRQNGLAVGGEPPPPVGTQDLGLVSRTADGGTTWTKVGDPAGFRNGVAWIRGLADTAVVVGPSGSDVSDDGGNTWTPVPNSPLLLGVDCLSEDACWAVGATAGQASFMGERGIAAKLTMRT